MPAARVVPSSHNFDPLLVAFLNRDPAAREALPRAVEPYLLKIARLLGGDLPEDIQREVVSQAMLNLVQQKPTSFNPARGNAATFLRLLVQNAVRQVRASYASPGHTTRRRKVKGTKVPVSAPCPAIVSLHELEVVDMPIVVSGTAAVEAQYDVEAVLRRAPGPLAASLKRLYLYGDGMDKVATDVGITRFTLRRQIADFFQEVRAAA